jgi:hypothetical protein
VDRCIYKVMGTMNPRIVYKIIPCLWCFERSKEACGAMRICWSIIWRSANLILSAPCLCNGIFELVQYYVSPSRAFPYSVCQKRNLSGVNFCFWLDKIPSYDGDDEGQGCISHFKGLILKRIGCRSLQG